MNLRATENKANTYRNTKKEIDISHECSQAAGGQERERERRWRKGNGEGETVREAKRANERQTERETERQRETNGCVL